MKQLITILIIALCSIISFGQTENKGEVVINTTQRDDTYRAGETIIVNAPIQGDFVVAGGNLIINDSINGDLTAAGGEVILNSYIADDARVAVGQVTIESDIGDNLVVFGGEVVLSKNAIVHGDINCFAGDIEIKGEVKGKINIKGGDVLIDGTIRESSKIIGQNITIGPNAQFHSDVEYWSREGELDFKNTLLNANAQFNKDLKKESTDTSLTTAGTKSVKYWVIYIFSAFLVILLLHALFRNAFSSAVEGLEDSLLKSFGFGLIYLIGIPLSILIAFLMVIGIPLGLFATGVFVFSLVFGHYVSALLIVYYLKNRNEKNWSFWSITFLALAVAILLRVLTMIPFAGVALAIVILSITYGALTLTAIHPKRQLN